MCIDKTKAIFLQDASEIVDFSGSTGYFEHALYDRIFRNREGTHGIKFCGSVIVPGKEVKSIRKDEKFENYICETLNQMTNSNASKPQVEATTASI
jgi:hypothetical protein